MLNVEIVNDGTGSTEYGNYRYRVLVNGQEIASGTVKNHRRSDGWEQLVCRLGMEAGQLRVVLTAQKFAEALKMHWLDTPSRADIVPLQEHERPNR